MNWLLQLDQRLFLLINKSWTNNFFDTFFPWITDLHKTVEFKVSILPILLLFFYWRLKKVGFVIFFMLLLCVAFSDAFGNYFFKKNFERARPGDVAYLQATVRSPYAGSSFISNHASNMFAFAAFVSLVLPSTRLFLYLLAFLVSYSRVYNGVHFPLDVICGSLCGIFWGFLFYRITIKVLENPHLKSKLRST